VHESGSSKAEDIADGPAVDAGLAVVPHPVEARRRLADPSPADPALAVVPGQEPLSRRAQRARRRALLAAANRWRLTKPVMASGGPATKRLVRSIAAETAIVLLIFTVAATLPAVSLLSPTPDVVMPTSITVAHWGRLLDGELFAESRRIDWHLLLRRTFGADSLQCPKCQGRLKILATVADRGAVTKILAHLGLATAPPPRAAARDPTDEQTTFDFDAA
jgi:hypothetical protein